jgi:hypothetical protein
MNTPIGGLPHPAIASSPAESQAIAAADVIIAAMEQTRAIVMVDLPGR